MIMTDSSSSKVETAKDQASSLKDEALSSGQHVAQTAADQAGSVVGEAKYQAKDLFTQAQGELRDQAGTQQKRVASGLRSVSDELNDMAGASQSGGLAADLVQQVASRAGGIASWLDDRDPGTLLSDVRSYAARKPGTFIAIAAVTGVVVGRLTRSLAGNAKDAKDAEGPSGTESSTSGLASSGTIPVDSSGFESGGTAVSGISAAGTTGLSTTYSDPVDTDIVAPVDGSLHGESLQGGTYRGGQQ